MPAALLPGLLLLRHRRRAARHLTEENQNRHGSKAGKDLRTVNELIGSWFGSFNRVAADGVLVVHFAFVLFAVFGALLTVIDVRWAWIHVPVVLWSSLVNLAG